MTRYDAYKFIHIAAAILWLGAGVMVQILAARANSTRDDELLKRLFFNLEWFGKVLFVPAALTVGVFGILMIVDGPWDWDQLWLILGLIGYTATFVTGKMIMEARGETIGEQIGRDAGVVTPASILDIRRLLAIARVDAVVLYLVVFDMVVKPTGDDTGVLVFMALVLLAGLGFVVGRARSLAAQPQPT